MCSFLSRIDNSVIVGFSFLLLSVSAIILSNTINILHIKGTKTFLADGVKTFLINGKDMLVNGAKTLSNPPFWLIFLVVPFNKIPLF